MSTPRRCIWCDAPIKGHVREGRYVICVGRLAAWVVKPTVQHFDGLPGGKE